MNNKKPILKLSIRLLFYSYFAAWSFLSLYSIQRESYNYTLQDDESYLISYQLSSSLLTGPEENKKLKYSELNGLRNYFTGKYVNSFGIQVCRLTGSYHFMKPGEIPALFSVNSFIDHPRPPPGSFMII